MCQILFLSKRLFMFSFLIEYYTLWGKVLIPLTKKATTSAPAKKWGYCISLRPSNTGFIIRLLYMLCISVQNLFIHLHDVKLSSRTSAYFKYLFCLDRN